uniref:Uncharacterized protein n=1 Tax=Steinernema glaseri TaxID=37863 RepID=A0A1I8A0G8_9BILA
MVASGVASKVKEGFIGRQIQSAPTPSTPSSLPLSSPSSGFGEPIAMTYHHFHCSLLPTNVSLSRTSAPLKVGFLPFAAFFVPNTVLRLLFFDPAQICVTRNDLHMTTPLEAASPFPDSSCLVCRSSITRSVFAHLAHPDCDLFKAVSVKPASLRLPLGK